MPSIAGDAFSSDHNKTFDNILGKLGFENIDLEFLTLDFHSKNYLTRTIGLFIKSTTKQDTMRKIVDYQSYIIDENTKIKFVSHHWSSSETKE